MSYVKVQEGKLIDTYVYDTFQEGMIPVENYYVPKLFGDESCSYDIVISGNTASINYKFNYKFYDSMMSPVGFTG